MDPEIIDLGSLDIGSGGRGGGGGDRVKSVNFGGGLELLMNDRFKSGGDKSGSTNINLEDITSLEDDLREMDSSSSSRNVKEMRSDLFNSSSSSSAFSNIKLSDRHDPFSNSIGGLGGSDDGEAGIGASTA